MLPHIQRKLQRIREGKRPRTIDLFAGCGGITLGFHSAGAEVVAAVEKNEKARQSHERNFGIQSGNQNYKAFDDIENYTPRQLVEHLLDTEADQKNVVDLVVGGPPCQPFSRIGRAKLRQIAQDPDAHLNDDRVTLYTRFMAVVEELEPLAFVMENVKDIGNFNRRNIAEEIALEADDLGYEVRYALLNAAWYRTPQTRERMIIVGIHKDLLQEPTFPPIQCAINLPVGYVTSRAGLARFQAVAEPCEHYVANAPQRRRLFAYTSARDAIGDLPEILHHLDKRSGRGVRRDLEKGLPYTRGPQGYSALMRKWPGFEGTALVTHNVIRYTPRDYEIFRRMEPGDEYPQAYFIAQRIFLERLNQLQTVCGLPIDHDPPEYFGYPLEETPEYERLMAETVPPYDPGKYPNKWRKIEPDKPVRTIPAHIGKDSYSHIHYSNEQARSISVREAARLQSFPDGFKFVGSMNDCLRQIGNSVPPLMSRAIARSVLRQIRYAARTVLQET